MGASVSTYPRVNDVDIPYNVYCLTKLQKHTKAVSMTEFQVFYESGELYIDSPNYIGPPSSLDYGNTKAHHWCFKKMGHCVTGSCGVFSYKLQNEDKKSIKLNIMWSAPYNHDHYINWFGVGFS